MVDKQKSRVQINRSAKKQLANKLLKALFDVRCNPALRDELQVHYGVVISEVLIGVNSWIADNVDNFEDWSKL